MSLNFLKKAAVAAGKVAEQDVQEEAPKKMGLSSLKSGSSLSGLNKTHTPPADDEIPDPKPQSSGGMNFLKKGAAAQAMLHAEQAKQDAAKEKAGLMFDFRMKGGEERKITFLDGELDGSGLLDITTYYEHNVPVAGGYDQYVCTAEEDTSQPCPLCSANNKRYLVGLLTVIDHTPYKIQNGPKAGQVVQNQRKLFKCKHGTIKVLTKFATKKGGLTGWTYDVSRSGGDKSPAVGDVFMPDVQWDSRGKFAGQYGLSAEDVQPANYGEQVIYKTPEQLIELGVGKSFTGVGTKKGGTVDAGSLKGQL
ncbi:hypothetical protein EVC30_027 [Rhizobium phage RHph_Y1_11]|nr:hypothetical protein EVC30_027 [Rhizobium phage RHph_Y1_11]